MKTLRLQEKMKPVTIMMPPSVIAQVRKTARVLYVSQNQVYRMAVLKYLAEKSSCDQPMF